ncbi:MAG TPA: hypothetical protein DCX54_13320 [Flavobacteriales bacterium]|nr:hypothetical protein [Flavobacteriales bacterium]
MDEIGSHEINSFEVVSNRLFVSRLYNVGFFNELFEEDGGYYEYQDHQGMQPSQTTFYNEFYWVADQNFGLALMYPWGGSKFITPNGPNTINTNNIDIVNGVLWSCSGLLDPDYQYAYNTPEFNMYSGLLWSGFDQSDQPILTDNFGFVKIAINPFNTSEVYSGSWDKGLLEMHDGIVTTIYNDTNKTTFNHTLSPVQGTNQIRIGGLAFDEDQNLWITNSQVSNALSVKKADGTWYNNFNLGGNVGDFTIVGELLIDRNGYKWILLNRKKEILVFNDNGTIDNPGDDEYTILNGQEGSGNIPGDRINCIAEDLNGAIWIGTNEGPAVIYSAASVFDSRQDAQRIYVQQDGQTQILLETENIKSIAVDGANRKWFGSTNSGVYLMSEDGATEISHFTKINSPLFSDDIKDIEINSINGEVFFCTDYGLISYKGTATQGDDRFSNVQVYPNPVPENYSGLVAIKGLAQNSIVKITDVNGLLVYQTQAKGGQAIWNGYSTSGKKARNGVYLVFSTDPKGEEHNVTKFLYLGN